MPRYKFDDCIECKFKRRPHVCRDCDYGEQFESADIEELNFDDHKAFSRSNKSLTTADDEPDHNPDDLIERAVKEREEDEENQEHYQDEEDE